MNLAIIFALGVLVGAIFTGIVFRLFLVGTLRVDHSDPDGPFLFLELSKRVEAIVSKKYVVMRVKAKEFGVTMDLSGNSGDAELDPLVKEIAKGHNYHFIGKVGQFCPIKPGCGGGILLRETENKKTGEKGYAAATGSKGFRWLESEMVRELGKENDIDRTYYNNLVDEAVKSLSSYGDFERFVADEPFVSDNTPPWFGVGEPHEEEPTPFDVR